MDSINVLLDLACEWAERQQDHILQNGSVLSAEQMNDARLAGVSHPENVRLLEVDQIPVEDLTAFSKKIDEYGTGQIVLLLVDRGGSTLFVTLRAR